jgi:hypothetical protein
MVVLMRLSTSDVGLRAIRGLVCADWDGSSEAIAGKLAKVLTTRVREILANELDIDLETEFDIYFVVNISTTIIQMLVNPF